MSVFLQYVAILVGTLALAVGWALIDFLTVGLAFLALGVLWAYGVRRGIVWASSVGFGLYIFLAMLSLWFSILPWLALAIVLSGLIAWDLDHFNRRFRLATDPDDRRRLQQQHFLRLGAVILPAVLVFWFSQADGIKVSFEGAVALSLLAVFGISALIYRLRSEA